MSSGYYYCPTYQPNTSLRFPARFNNGDITIQRSIVAFAADKLLCGHGITGWKIEGSESLACLAVRLGLDFRTASWLDRKAERTQVERHMRICLAATVGFRSMITISPSEPLLAEALYTIMGRSLGAEEAPKALLAHITGSYLSAGDRGEVVAALLLLLARDKAVGDKARRCDGMPPLAMSLEDFKGDGDSRIVTVPEFVDALVPEGSHSFVKGLRPSYCSPRSFVVDNSRGRLRLIYLFQPFHQGARPQNC